jgi:predicted nucleic acid-binding Zn ribbon protein
VSDPELAPFGKCIVCGKEVPRGTGAYLAGATPAGAITCEGECKEIAIARHFRGERVDGKGKR